MTADDEDSDETASVLFKRTKPKQVIHESTGGIFSDASTGTAATALSKEEVTVEDASDEDVLRPNPPSTSSSRDKQVDEADLPTNQDPSDDWEDVPEEEVPVISSVKAAAAKKLSPKKNQATIKSMFQRQKKQQQDQQRGQSNGDAVAAGDYKFNLEDPITAVMDEALVQ
eukprot:scaffold165393_cov50-Cyclotella_meneghiniana.AAC.1